MKSATVLNTERYLTLKKKEKRKRRGLVLVSHLGGIRLNLMKSATMLNTERYLTLLPTFL